MNYGYDPATNEVKAQGVWPKDRESALDESILKWRKLAIALDNNEFENVPPMGTRTCALCQLYFEGGACYVCPVKNRTGRSGCMDTPYDEYQECANAARYSSRYKLAAKAAWKEVRFLESLRPANEALASILSLAQEAKDATDDLVK